MQHRAEVGKVLRLAAIQGYGLQKLALGFCKIIAGEGREAFIRVKRGRFVVILLWISQTMLLEPGAPILSIRDKATHTYR